LLNRTISASNGTSAAAYSFDDEISTGGFCTPIETDGSPLSVAGYRKFLESMYGSSEALNAEHGSDWKAFDAVEPRSYEAVRNQIRPDTLGKLNLSPWCDWRSYMDTQWSNALAELTRTANAIDPETPAGYGGGQAPCAYGGQDYRKLTQAVQWVEA